MLLCSIHVDTHATNCLSKTTLRYFRGKNSMNMLSASLQTVQCLPMEDQETIYNFKENNGTSC